MRLKVKVKVKQYSSPERSNLRAMSRHLPLPYGITQRYLPPDTSELAPPI